MNGMSEDMIEEEQLRVLAESAGKEAVEPILAAFWTSNDELVAQLGAALKDRDTDSAGKAAHALKGSAANLGATQVASTAKDIELCAKGGKMDAALSAFEKLPREIAETKAAFDTLMSSIG